MRLTHVSALVNAYNSVLLIPLPSTEVSENVALCQFDSVRRSAAWAKACANLGTTVPALLQASASVFDLDGLKASPLLPLCGSDVWTWIEQFKGCLFLLVRPYNGSGLLSIGWLIPESADGGAGCCSPPPHWGRVVQAVSPAPPARRCRLLLNGRELVDYLLTRMHVCWPSTRIHVLGDVFRAADHTMALLEPASDERAGGGADTSRQVGVYTHHRRPQEATRRSGSAVSRGATPGTQ